MTTLPQLDPGGRPIVRRPPRTRAYRMVRKPSTYGPDRRPCSEPDDPGPHSLYQHPGNPNTGGHGADWPPFT